MASDDKIKQLLEKRELAKLGGGQKRIDSQHKKGKLTASWYMFSPRTLLFSEVPLVRDMPRKYVR